MIAITVEEEEDIEKFKDYTPSASGDKVPADKAEPSTPKKEVIEEPPKAPEPKVSQPSSVASEDRIFASPVARKMAEDHKVSW